MNHSTYRKSFLFLITALFVLVMAACSSSNETAKQDKSSNESESYTVEHAMGKTTIPNKPERVVILTNEGTEALLALGVKPVGAVQSWLGDPWYDHIKNQMEDVEVVGLEHEVNVEKIAELQPDLIIGNKMRQEAIYEQLSQIAPTVFAETLRGEWQENFKLYAKALNMEEKGKEVIAEYEAHVEEVKEKLGDKVDQEVSVVRFMAGNTRIYYTDSFSGIILDQVGFKRAEHQKGLFTEDNKLGLFAIEVGKEQIPEMDGDVIFYFTYAPNGDQEAIQTEKEWTNDPLWQNLGAVKNGKVYKVDDAIWNTAGGVIAANLMLDDLVELLGE